MCESVGRSPDILEEDGFGDCCCVESCRRRGRRERVGDALAQDSGVKARRSLVSVLVPLLK